MAEAAIIIPHYNDTARLERCLRALMAQLSPQVEVIVVDNASTDSLDPLRSHFAGLRIVIEPRKGAACARNRGVAETTAPLLFFLDCDCVPDADWVATALRLAKTSDIIGGAVRVFDETAPPRTGAQAFEAVFAFDNRAYVEQKGFSVTANLLTRRDVFQAVGEFIPGLSEDLDWCHRARARGYRLAYAPDLRVAHPSRGDWAALRKKWRRLTDEMFAVNGDGLGPQLRWGLKALAMPISILLHAPKIMKSRILQSAKERKRGLSTLIRLRLARMVWMAMQVLGSKP